MAEQDGTKFQGGPPKPSRKNPYARTRSDGLVTLLTTAKGSGGQNPEIKGAGAKNRKRNPSEGTEGKLRQPMKSETTPAFFTLSSLPDGSAHGNGCDGAENGGNTVLHNGRNSSRKIPLMPPSKPAHRSSSLKSDSSDSSVSSKSDSSGSVFRPVESAAQPSNRDAQLSDHSSGSASPSPCPRQGQASLTSGGTVASEAKLSRSAGSPDVGSRVADSAEGTLAQLSSKPTQPNIEELQFENDALRRQIFHLKQQQSNLTTENQQLCHNTEASGQRLDESGNSSTQESPVLGNVASSGRSSSAHSQSTSPTPPPPPSCVSPVSAATRKLSPPSVSTAEGVNGEKQDAKQQARIHLARVLERAKATSPNSVDPKPQHQPVTKSQTQVPPPLPDADRSSNPSITSPLSPLSPLSTPSPTLLVSNGLSSQAKRKKSPRLEDQNGKDDADISGEKADKQTEKETVSLPSKPQPAVHLRPRKDETCVLPDASATAMRTEEQSASSHRQMKKRKPEGSHPSNKLPEPSDNRHGSSKPSPPKVGQFAGKLSKKSAVSETAKRFQSASDDQETKPKTQKKMESAPDFSSQLQTPPSDEPGQTEERFKESVSSESDDVFSTRGEQEPTKVVVTEVESKKSSLPRVVKSESQVGTVALEAGAKRGVLNKRNVLKSDVSWIKSKDPVTSEGVDADQSGGVPAPQRSESPAVAPSRSPVSRPYRSHVTLNTASPPPSPPTVQPAKPTPPRAYKSTSSQPILPTTSVSKQQSKGLINAPRPNPFNRDQAKGDKRGRVASTSEGKSSKSKRRGGGVQDKKSGFVRSASDESLSNTLTRREKVAPSAAELPSSGQSGAPKRPPRPWTRDKESEKRGGGGGARPASVLVGETSSSSRMNAWGGESQDDELTASCTVPSGSPGRDKKFRKASEPFVKKGSIFGRLKGKSRDKDKPRIPDPMPEEEEETDSSSEDEKGGTIKCKPKLRPVSVRRASLVEDDFDLSYPQLFERVFVVGLKQDPMSKKLVTEVTYTFPPRPTAETGRDGDMEAIPQFCFPDIARMKPTTKWKSETFSFVLTNMEGHRRFGYSRRLLPSGRGARLPEVTCLVSPLGCFSLYEKILDHIEERRQVSASAVFTFLKAIVANPFPKPGRSVQVRAFSARGTGMETVTFTRPLDSRLEHVDFSLLFTTLSHRKIIQLISSMLMERRIILCANNLSLVTGCAHALLALIYPFEWQHVFIPVLPDTLIDFCCSPLPYIIGINPSCIRKLDDMETMEEALIVDLDKKKFAKKIGDETSILPSKLFQYLEHALGSSVVAAEYQKPASRRASSSRADEIVINTFMLFFVYLYGDYKEYMTRRSDGAMEFQKKDYEKKFSSKSIRRFLEAFHMTQMFEHFIEQRENPLKAETTAQSSFEKHSIPEMKQRCVEIEIFSSKSKISRWRLKKRI